MPTFFPGSGVSNFFTGGGMDPIALSIRKPKKLVLFQGGLDPLSPPHPLNLRNQFLHQLDAGRKVGY